MDAQRRLPGFLGRASRVGTLALIALVLAGCGGADWTPPPTVPTHAEAVSLLRQIWAVVASRDLSRLCDYGTGPCAKAVREVDPASIPTLPPTVTGSWVLPTQRASSNAWWIGGRVLELCGVDGLGQPYSSEMLVFRDGSRLVAVLPVFWTGMRIARGDTVGVPIPGRTPGPCPAASAPASDGT